MTATLRESETEDDLAVHQVVEPPVPTRTRVIGASVMILTGLVTILGWGIGARNGDAAFAISFITDRWQVPVLRYPGGGAAMVMGALIAVLGAYHLARGFRRAQLRWVVPVVIVLFVLGFLSWAATGDPSNPISLPGLVTNSVVAAIPFVLGALSGIVCERSRVIIIAIEGQMLVGAIAGALF